MHPDGSEAKAVMQQTADDVDQAKRSSSPKLNSSESSTLDP